MNTITKEELLSSKSSTHMTMKDIRRFVENNPDIDDDAPVLTERIEDVYFNDRDFNGHKIKYSTLPIAKKIKLFLYIMIVYPTLCIIFVE